MIDHRRGAIRAIKITVSENESESSSYNCQQKARESYSIGIADVWGQAFEPSPEAFQVEYRHIARVSKMLCYRCAFPCSKRRWRG